MSINTQKDCRLVFPRPITRIAMTDLAFSCLASGAYGSDMTAFLSHTVQQITSFDTIPLLLTRLSLRVRDDLQAEHSPISRTAWERLTVYEPVTLSLIWTTRATDLCCFTVSRGFPRWQTTGQGRRDSELLVTGISRGTGLSNGVSACASTEVSDSAPDSKEEWEAEIGFTLYLGIPKYFFGRALKTFLSIIGNKQNLTGVAS